MTMVSFIGLGVMGLPMAANLVGAGFDVIAYTRSESSRERARSRGLTVVDAISELPQDPDVVVTVLPDAPDVAEVLDAYTPLLSASTTVVDMSTISPAAARALSAQLGDSGHRMLDAPVSGGEAGAIEGSLSIMVGGEAGDLERARPVLEAMGATIVHVGPAGAGQVVKAANQLIVAGNIQILAEALLLIEAQGIAADSALDVLAGGLAGSTVLQRKRQAMLDRRFAPGFRVELHQKDLDIAAETARESGVPLPSGALVTQLIRSLVAQGDGGLDHSALYSLQARLAGRPVA